MNLSQTKDQKSELNEQLEVELKRLAKKQKEEYDRNFQNQVMEGLMDYNIARIRSMLNDGKFIQASNEVDSLLKMKRSWKYLELKLLCITKNFTTNTLEAARLLNEIKNSDIPEVKYKRILSTIQSSEKDKKIALEKEKEIVYYDRSSSKKPISKRDALAYMEHLRWNAFMITYGYIPMEKALIRVDVVDGKIKLYKNDVTKRLHACITTDEGLEEYFKFMSNLIVKHTNKTYEEAFKIVENKCYDYMLMDTIYDDIALMGLYIKKI